jgi:hypothetical protein
MYEKICLAADALTGVVNPEGREVHDHRTSPLSIDTINKVVYNNMVSCKYHLVVPFAIMPERIKKDSERSITFVEDLSLQQ